MASLIADYERAGTLYEESVSLCREAGHQWGLAFVLAHLGTVHERRGEYAQAAALQEEALQLYRSVGKEMGITWSLLNLGWALLALGEPEQATAHLKESLTRSREEGHWWGTPFALSYLGWAAYWNEEYQRAIGLQEEALAWFRQVRYRWGVAWTHIALGYMLQAQSVDQRAADCLREGLQLSQALGARGLVAEGLEGMAWLAVSLGESARAAQLGGAAEALRATQGAALHPVLLPGHERALRKVRSSLGAATCAAVWVEGKALLLEEAIALAPVRPDRLDGQALQQPGRH